MLSYKMVTADNMMLVCDEITAFYKSINVSPYYAYIQIIKPGNNVLLIYAGYTDIPVAITIFTIIPHNVVILSTIVSSNNWPLFFTGAIKYLQHYYNKKSIIQKISATNIFGNSIFMNLGGSIVKSNDIINVYRIPGIQAIKTIVLPKFIRELYEY